MTDSPKNWTPEEVSAQLRKPDGEGGLIVASNMQTVNKVLYDKAFEFIEPAESATILEIGFGNGAHFKRYYEIIPNAKIYGLDYSQTMCDEAAKLNPELIDNEQLKLSLGEASKMPYESNQFDIAVAINTIYFWEPIKDYFAEIKRVLKPGGMLILGYRPKEILKHYDFSYIGFVHYSPDELQGILTNSGFGNFREKRTAYMRTAVNGHTGESVDICLEAKKK